METEEKVSRMKLIKRSIIDCVNRLQKKIFYGNELPSTDSYISAMNKFTKNTGAVQALRAEREGRSRWQIALFAVILVGFLAAYYFTYALKTFPYTEGWGEYYVELMKQGLMPYRDFYYYLPPLNLFIDYILWSMSGGLFAVYRILRVVERLLMMTVLFIALCRLFKPSYVLIACVFAGIIGGGSSYDLLGDYNQTEQFLFILLAICAAYFIKQNGKKNRCIAIGVCGIILGLLFMLKQSSSAAAIIVYFLFLVVYCLFEKDKNFFWYVLAVICGIAAVVGIFFIWLAANGALVAYFDQVFGAATAKGGLSVLFTSILDTFLDSEKTGTTNFIVFCAFVLLFWAGSKIYRDAAKQRYIHLALAIFAGYILYWSFIVTLDSWLNIVTANAALLFIALAGVPAVIYFVVKRSRVAANCPIKENVSGGFEALFFILFLAVNLILIVVNFAQISDQIYATISQSGIDVVLATLYYAAYFGSIAWIIYVVIMRIVRGKWVVQLQKFVLLVGVAASIYAVSLASGGYAVMRALFLGLSVLVLLLFGSKPFRSRIAKGVLCILLSFSCVLSCVQKMECVYSWWGWADEPVYTKTESVDIDALKGFSFSEKEKNLYEQSVKLIENNITQEETLWTFPYTPIFKLLTGHTEQVGFVPVYFFDVCADKYASAEVELLNADLPDMIIWCDLGTDCWDTHEYLFREDGRSGQRDIQRWFVDIKDEKYDLVGQVESLFFYRLKDGTEPGYTYFQDPTRVNVTALPENCK